MGVDTGEIDEISFSRRFRLGEKVYVSKKEVTMPVVMKVGVDDYIKKKIVMNLINREGDFFLCGLKTLQEWKAAVFYERNEMEFNVTKNRVLMKISKEGHQLIKLEYVGEWSNERSVHYLETKEVSNKSSK